MSDTEGARLTAAVIAHQWTPGRTYTAHNCHSYYYGCAVCAKDVPGIVRVIQEAQRE